MLDCLLGAHSARFSRHCRRGEHGNGWTISDFDATGGLTEFQMLKTLTCGFTNPCKLLLYRREQQNDIRFACRKGHHTATGTANENGGMWLLYRPGNRAQFRRCVVVA